MGKSEKDKIVTKKKTCGSFFGCLNSTTCHEYIVINSSDTRMKSAWSWRYSLSFAILSARSAMRLSTACETVSVISSKNLCSSAKKSSESPSFFVVSHVHSFAKQNLKIQRTLCRSSVSAVNNPMQRLWAKTPQVDRVLDA